jgi:hypothetical protein
MCCTRERLRSVYLRAEVRARGCERTAIWWPKSWSWVSIAAAMNIVSGAYLDADLAQVAQRSHKRRHGCAVCSGVVMLVGCRFAIDDAKSGHDAFPMRVSSAVSLRQTPLASQSGVAAHTTVQSHPVSNMIIRSLLRAQAPKIAGRRTFRIPNWTLKTTRSYSTSNASMASSTPQSQASMLATISTDLDKIAPRFEIQPEQIQIIQTPAEFYTTLKVGA